MTHCHRSFSIIFPVDEVSEALLSWIEGWGVWALLKKPNPFSIDLVVVFDQVAFVVLPSYNIEATLCEEIYVPFGWSDQ